MYYVYVLKSKLDGKHYIGCTRDLRQRFDDHNHNKVRSTKNNGPYELIYYEAYKSEHDAFKREKNLKLRSNAFTALRKRLVESF